MKILCLEKLKILFDKQDESIRKTWTFPFWVNALSFSSLGLKSQHAFRHPSHGLSSQMKNERMNLIVRHSVSSVYLPCHTPVSTVFVCWLSLQKTNTYQVFCSLQSSTKDWRLSLKDCWGSAATPNYHIWYSHRSKNSWTCFAIGPPSIYSKLLAMVLSRFGHPKKRDAQLCHLLKAFYPLWISGCRTVKRSQGSNQSEVGAMQGCVPTLHTGTILWAPAPLPDKADPSTPVGAGIGKGPHLQNLISEQDLM